MPPDLRLWRAIGLERRDLTLAARTAPELLMSTVVTDADTLYSSYRERLIKHLLVGERSSGSSGFPA